jgi:hypothetical protein
MKTAGENFFGTQKAVRRERINGKRRIFFHHAFRHCAEQNSCSDLFLQNSFPQRLHLTSTFFSIHCSKEKGQEVNLRPDWRGELNF